ncbi:MAG: hypothetical protein EXS42_04860 [Lacunisphaera sp.]|nr:hypothetical protein [Lacunisphaera sp.]
MRKSRIKAKLRANKPAILVCAHLGDPSIHELMSLMGFDGVWIDMEHHFHTMETAANLMRAIRVGSADGVLRPAKGEFMRMGRMLETGALGIFYPRCDHAQEAAEVVRWSKFFPEGCRGVDGGGPDMPYCTMDYAEYVRMANEETSVVMQLEDPAAMEHAERIAAVPGVDVTWIASMSSVFNSSVGFNFILTPAGYLARAQSLYQSEARISRQNYQGKHTKC